MKATSFYRADDESFEDPFIIRLYVKDYNPYTSEPVCADYNVDAPNAVAEYRCKGTGQYVYVIDTESGPNPEFPNFDGLERVESTPIFYVHHADDCSSA
ncbi:unnamed protein product [Cylicocyclus nassatus]|uniref:Uncharacterized protein n=1 Tax=Cylicocyclus nassatus TaxID=53992 RepID=A0AA36M8B3_CYLNA|nr:unnamed protein product [Cylicocyclus nassatus]